MLLETGIIADANRFWIEDKVSDVVSYQYTMKKRKNSESCKFRMTMTREWIRTKFAGVFFRCGNGKSVDYESSGKYRKKVITFARAQLWSLLIPTRWCSRHLATLAWVFVTSLWVLQSQPKVGWRNSVIKCHLHHFYKQKNMARDEAKQWKLLFLHRRSPPLIGFIINKKQIKFHSQEKINFVSRAYFSMKTTIAKEKNVTAWKLFTKNIHVWFFAK